MKHLSALLCLSLFTFSTANAQNWVVGQNVDMPLGSLNLFGGCYPTDDYIFHFPASQVTGVQHIAIVTMATPPTTITVVPGTSGALDVGDTVFFPTGIQRHVQFTAGYGQLMLDFKAVGVPTTAGQVHPCTEAPNWISDLMICPEELSHTLQNNCTTQLATTVDELSADAVHLTAPDANNGYTLQVTGAHLVSVEVFDAVGRSTGRYTQGFDRIDVGPLAAGVHLVVVQLQDGRRVTERFVR